MSMVEISKDLLMEKFSFYRKVLLFKLLWYFNHQYILCCKLLRLSYASCNYFAYIIQQKITLIYFAHFSLIFFLNTKIFPLFLKNIPMGSIIIISFHIMWLCFHLMLNVRLLLFSIMSHCYMSEYKIAC